MIDLRAAPHVPISDDVWITTTPKAEYGVRVADMLFHITLYILTKAAFFSKTH